MRNRKRSQEWFQGVPIVAHLSAFVQNVHIQNFFTCYPRRHEHRDSTITTFSYMGGIIG